MKKAKIYIPSKTAMQSGKGKSKNWLLEFDTKDPSTNPFMGSSKRYYGRSKVRIFYKRKSYKFC